MVKQTKYFCNKSVCTDIGGKSGRFRKFNSQKIFSKTWFDRKYFENQNSSRMVKSKLKKVAFSFVFVLYLRLKPWQELL